MGRKNCCTFHKISSLNRLNKTESPVFLICMSSLFLKDPFSQIIKRSQQLLLCRVELVKLLPVH